MIIHLTGPDTYRARQRLIQLREAFLAKHDPAGLNIATLDGDSASADDIRQAISSGGLFAAKRFVVIDRYLTSGAACAPDALATVLASVAKSADTIVVVLSDGAEAKSTKKGSKTKKGSTAKGLAFAEAKTETFPLLSLPQLQTWLLKEAKSIGGEMTPAMAAEFLALVGSDTWRLANELEKIVAYTHGRPITSQDLQTMIVSPEASDIFALTDAVGQQRRAVAVRLLHRELSAGTNPLALIAAIANHLWNLWRVQQASAAGMSAEVMAKHLGLHPFVVKKCMAQARTFPPALIARWHHQLVEIDVTLKSSSLDAEALLDVMLLKT